MRLGLQSMTTGRGLTACRPRAAGAAVRMGFSLHRGPICVYDGLTSLSYFHAVPNLRIASAGKSSRMLGSALARRRAWVTSASTAKRSIADERASQSVRRTLSSSRSAAVSSSSAVGFSDWSGSEVLIAAANSSGGGGFTRASQSLAVIPYRAFDCLPARVGRRRVGHDSRDNFAHSHRIPNGESAVCRQMLPNHFGRLRHYRGHSRCIRNSCLGHVRFASALPSRSICKITQNCVCANPAIP